MEFFYCEQNKKNLHRATSRYDNEKKDTTHERKKCVPSFRRSSHGHTHTYKLYVPGVTAGIYIYVRIIRGRFAESISEK